jgi:cobalamin biosynthesis Mg chelatase CobN
MCSRRKMKRSIYIISVAILFSSCRSVPQIATASKIIEAQTDAAIETATVATLADSTVQDAEHLLEAVKETGNSDLVYIAKKHVAETKKISEKSKEIQAVQKEERAATADHIEEESKAATVAAEVKEDAAVSGRTIAMLIGFAVVLALAGAVWLFFMIRKKLLRK